MARKRRVFFRTLRPRREGSRRVSRASLRGAARAVWVRRERRPLATFWGDRDRRRALLLSLLLHAAALLSVVWLSTVPSTAPEREPEELIVLELAPPESGAQARVAAATNEPAPAGADAQAAGNAAEEVLAAPEATGLEDAPEAPVRPETAQSEPLPPSENPPQARLPTQTAATFPDLPVQAPASTLPEIQAAVVAPQPLDDALALPTPNPEADVTPPRRVSVIPEVAVTEAQALPTPEVTASIVTRPVALPRVQTVVAEGDAIPRPDVSTEVVSRVVPEPQVDAAVSQAQPVPQPEVQAEVASAVPEPQVGAVVAQTQAVPQPGVTAAVASADVPEPQVGVVVREAQRVPQPVVSGSASPGEDVPQPEVGVVVTQARPLTVTPGVALSEAVSIVTPRASATVAPQAAADAGSGPRNAQVEAGPRASPTGQGAASDGLGGAAAGVAEVQSFEATLENPLAVLIDNADAAYPQGGLVEAAGVFEMPVEGGMTRLMSVYTKDDPAQVGPIRSARDYFLEAVLQMNGTLVHVGGAPSTVNRIATEGLATVDALEQSTLFAQAQDRSAPHSTFSTGTTLRDAVGRIPSQVSGTLYAPPADAEDVSSLTVGYSAEYTSGFRYLSDLDQYRWLRSGADAVDAAGTAVAADAVVVARVVAFPYSGDPEGRLYLPYSGGAATLYLRGKAVLGTWTPEGGFSFFAPTGLEVDLTPFKHWILFAPEAAQVTVQ